MGPILFTLLVGTAGATPPDDSMVVVRLDHATYVAMPVQAVAQIEDDALGTWLDQQRGGGWHLLPPALGTGTRVDRLIASGCGSAVRIGRGEGSLSGLTVGLHRGGEWWVFPDETPFAPASSEVRADTVACGAQQTWIGVSTAVWDATTHFGLLVAQRSDVLGALESVGATDPSDRRVGRWVAEMGEGLHVAGEGHVQQQALWDHLVDQGVAWTVLPRDAGPSGALVRGPHPAPRPDTAGEWWLHPRSGAVVWPAADAIQP